MSSTCLFCSKLWSHTQLDFSLSQKLQSITVHPAYMCIWLAFLAPKALPSLKIFFCPREGRSMLSPPALGSSRRQGSPNDPSGGRRSSQEGLWGRLSSQEAIGGLSRQSLFGGLSALASSRHLGSPEGNGGKSRRSSAENAGISPGGRAPPLGAAAKRGSFFMPDLPRFADNLSPHALSCCCCHYLCQGHVPRRSMHVAGGWTHLKKVQLHTCNQTNPGIGTNGQLDWSPTASLASAQHHQALILATSVVEIPVNCSSRVASHP